jgi:hypothetical protein
MGFNTAEDAAKILKSQCVLSPENEIEPQAKHDMMLLCAAAVANGQSGTGAVRTAACTLAALDTIIEAAIRMNIIDEEESTTKKGDKADSKKLKERKGNVHKLLTDAARYG